jgi:hypothetical protein
MYNKIEEKTFNIIDYLFNPDYGEITRREI